MKIIFYSPIQLSPKSEKFIIKMLTHERQEYNKLGIFSLYCVALALQERIVQVNLAFFTQDIIVRILLKFIKDSKSEGASSYTN